MTMRWRGPAGTVLESPPGVLGRQLPASSAHPLEGVAHEVLIQIRDAVCLSAR